MRQRDVAALDAKYTKELADAKAENDACVMMLPLVVVGCTSKQSVSQCVKPLPPPAWIMQPPPDWQTPLNGIISPSERGWSLCKNNWKEPRSILMSSADRVAHIDVATHAIIVSNTHALPAEYKCLKLIKPSNPFTNVCRVSVLTTFRAATNFGCIDSFLCPIPETKKWWVMVSLVLLLPVCFLNSKRLLSTSCNKQGQRSSE